MLNRVKMVWSIFREIEIDGFASEENFYSPRFFSPSMLRSKRLCIMMFLDITFSPGCETAQPISPSSIAGLRFILVLDVLLNPPFEPLDVYGQRVLTFKGEFHNIMRCRVPKPSVLSLLLVQAVAVVLLFGWYNLPPSQNTSLSEGKVHVLLLSSWRSGSSFLGQAFSQHPDVFYLMEPGWHVWTSIKQAGARSLRMAVRDIIRSIFQCDFSVMDSYIPQQQNISHLFMWSHSRALCSPPACPLTPRNEISKEPECKTQCNTRGLRLAEAACLTYSHVVLKEVRFFELESLYPLLQDPELDLRIIHLVRDPRAVFRSREQSAKALAADTAIVLEQADVPEQDKQYKILEEVCRSHVRIYETAMLKPPDFLRGRYKMVRYEDLVHNTLAEIEHMYQFVGLELNENLQEWLYRITHGKGKGTKKEAFKITSRNAEDVSLAWRTTLPHEKVQRIQDVCKGAMSMLGYKTVNSENEQKLLDLDLLTPRERYQFSWLPSKGTTAKV